MVACTVHVTCLTATVEIVPVSRWDVGTYRPYSISGGSVSASGCVVCLGYVLWFELWLSGVL